MRPIESAHVKEFGKFFGSWNAESRGKFLLVESRIQLRKFRILLKIEIQNPCSTEKDWNQESTTCNLESKTVLNSLTRGEIEALVARTVVELLVERSRFSTRLIYTDHRQLVSRTWITNGKMVLRLLWPCLVPRPHYYARPMRFGSRGPRKFLRPRQTRWSHLGRSFWKRASCQ